MNHYPMINQLFTQYNTHNEVLKICGSHTREVKQNPPYQIIAMDFDGVMKVMPIIWSNLDRFIHHTHRCLPYNHELHDDDAEKGSRSWV